MSLIPRIFIAYARQDAHLLEKLRKPLNVLRRNQHCDIFYDGEIVPGERWDDRLKSELHQADIFVLLVTDDFLDSDYVNDVELSTALEKESEGRAKVIPIILRHCMWQYTLLSKFQVILHEGRPIEPSDGYVHAAHEIARVMEQRNKAMRVLLEDKERKKLEAERLGWMGDAFRKKDINEAYSPELMEDLFAFTVTSDRPMKLGELPIVDIRKAMGLSERISTLNELFGRDGMAFDAAITTLNSLRSFDEAKHYLIQNVAGKYEWTKSDERKLRAKDFIKLVRRRYL